MKVLAANAKKIIHRALVQSNELTPAEIALLMLAFESFLGRRTPWWKQIFGWK